MRQDELTRWIRRLLYFAQYGVSKEEITHRCASKRWEGWGDDMAFFLASSSTKGSDPVNPSAVFVLHGAVYNRVSLLCG